MPSGAAVRRYAQAVFEMADEQGTLDRWERDLGALAGAFDDPAVTSYFDSPQIPVSQKRETAYKLLGADALPRAGKNVASHAATVS